MNQPSLLDTTAAFALLIDAPPALSDKARKIEGVLRVKLSDGFGRICEFLDDSDVVADTIGQPGAEAEEPHHHCIDAGVSKRPGPADAIHRVRCYG